MTEGITHSTPAPDPPPKSSSGFIATISSLSTVGGVGILSFLYTTLWPAINNQPVLDEIQVLQDNQVKLEHRVDELTDAVMALVTRKDGGRGDVRRFHPDREPPVR